MYRDPNNKKEVETAAQTSQETVNQESKDHNESKFAEDIKKLKEAIKMLGHDLIRLN